MIFKLLIVAFAGGLGAASRYVVGLSCQRLLGPDFPWATFIVNVVGCLLFGFVVSQLARREVLRPEVQLLLLTGFMGAFTTFSTYMFETLQLVEASRWAAAMANFTGQNVLGGCAMLLGLQLGRL